MSSQSAAPDVKTDREPREPDAIRDEIHRTREDMGRTLDALTAKLDVKSQAKAKVDQARQNVQSIYQRQPAAIIAGAGAVVALLVVMVVRRSRR
jgi:hypothetical protein